MTIKNGLSFPFLFGFRTRDRQESSPPTPNSEPLGVVLAERKEGMPGRARRVWLNDVAGTKSLPLHLNTAGFSTIRNC